MIKKIKISDLAKDLNLSSKELIETLQPYCDFKLKTMSSLTEELVNIVLDIYTKKNEVESFDSYFALARSHKKPSAEKSSSEKSSTAKGVSVKGVAEKVVAAKADVKNMEGSVSSVSELARKKSEFKSKSLQNSKKVAVKKAEVDLKKPVASNDKAKVSKTEKANKTSSKASGSDGLKSASADSKKQGGQKAGSRQGERQSKTGFKLTKTIKLSPKIDDSSSSVDVLAQNSKRRLVDTKAASPQVNFEKYDERYENMARGSRFDGGFTRKQKFKKAVSNKAIQKKETKAQKQQRLALEKARSQKLKISIPDEILVSELASRLKTNVGQLVKKLMGLGVMANINDFVDYDTAAVVAQELGAEVEREINLTIEERLFEDDYSEVDESKLQKREPIVVVMGHVDHGKTSLLDKVCHLDVASSEAGGITQHIGAYKVTTATGAGVTFLDTPGHEAFTSMRMRGANMTDIVVLVVAADDGIMPQTIEAIDHAKSAEVSIIVAINKIDKPQANVEKIKQELMAYDLVAEEWGGDVICVPVSAKTGEGIDQLLEMIDLVAEVKGLKANASRSAKGTVIEARLDKGRGPVATLLVQDGTLKVGDSVIAGVAVGHVRTMLNDKGKSVKQAGPSTPVEVTGLSEVPQAGDTFNVIENEKLAKELVEKRKFKQKQDQFGAPGKVTLETLFSQIEDGERKEIAIIVKADVQGSAEALKTSFEKLSNEEVKVKVIHRAVGAINKSDVMLAVASNAIVVGFNVRPDAVAKQEAEENNVDLRRYSVIYDAILDVEKAIKGLLAPKTKVVELGEAEVRQVYKISSVGTIAGCFVSRGKVTRNSQVRLFRDGVAVVQDEKIKSLKRFKDDVREVASGYECGIGLFKFNDIKVGDIMEFFNIETVVD